MDMTLGQIIYSYRTEQGISMQAFSEKSGISKQYVSLLERNRHPATGKPITPSLVTVARAAAAMEMELAALLRRLGREDDCRTMLGRECDVCASPSHLKADFCLRVGQTPFSRFYPGDIICFKKEDALIPGKLYAVELQGGVYICRLTSVTDTSITLKYNKGKDETVTYYGAAKDDLRFLGRAVFFSAEL